MTLYLTIWAALVLFVSGEQAWSRAGERPGSLRRAQGLHATAILLLVVHILISFATVHGWSHAAAVAATAARTESVFGVHWGGGVWANYAFVAVWILDTQWWRAGLDPRRASRAGLWILRSFYLVFLVNAAVIFAAGWRRGLGMILLGALVWVWLPRARR